MAIYHLNVRHCSVGKGQSAKAKSDYINRDEKYSKKLDDLQYKCSANMPEFAKDNPSYFWECADIYERANARVCTEIEFALPREFNTEQQLEVVNDFISKTISNDDRKLPYSFAIHNDKENNNPHCHLIFSSRNMDGIERDETVFFKRANSKNAELGGAKKDRTVIQKEFLESVRKQWTETANEHLERNGINERIDDRTLEAQGIDREPLQRIPRAEYQYIQQLEKQELADINRFIKKIDYEIAIEKRAEILTENLKNSLFKAKKDQSKTEIQENHPKTPQNSDLEKPNQLIKQREKMPQKANKELSQVEFDQFMVDKWLEPNKKLNKADEKLNNLTEQRNDYIKQLDNIQNQYDKENKKNKGFLGLYETKEQKQKKADLAAEFERVAQKRNEVTAERDDLQKRRDEFYKKELEPIEKQIKQMMKDNPQLERRTNTALTKMKFMSVKKWNEKYGADAQRKQAQEKAKSRAMQKDDGMSL